MSRFFINRPVFAWVLAIITMLAGIISIKLMPVEQYSSIAAPSVSISASMPGASAETLETAVTQVIEQSLTGIDGMRYFSSQSSASGSVTTTITFEPEVNPDIAQVQVQNKVQSAIPLLPQEVINQGVTVTKGQSSMLLVVGMYSKTGETSYVELGDIIASNMKDTISRVNGVGSVNVFASQRSMRIWLKPEKLFSYALSPAEIVQSIKEQNSEVSAGQLGDLPAIKGQQINATVSVNSRLKTVEQFQNILLKTLPNGGKVLLKDVARIEFGSENYAYQPRYNKNDAVGMSISLATGANALNTVKAVKEKVEELKQFLPNDVEIIYPVDVTPFINLSIKSVIVTLIEAFILVFIVMFLFLQNFRATLIPAIAIPVVLLGTFTVLNIFGFSINILTMFAMVLSIGLLVDDAIVVVENVERVMEEEGLSPLEATKKSMDQIQGALIGIAVVLSAVFVPMAFFSGATGTIYRQFSITIVSSMTFSVLVALILSPTMCASLLKQKHETNFLTHNKFFEFFNKSVTKGQDFYANGSTYIIAKIVRFLLIYVIMLGGIAFLFLRMPTSFIPDEDKGSMYLMLIAPEGATMERTLQSLEKAENYFLENEKENVEGIFTVAGWSFAGVAQNGAFGFIILKDWSERKRPDQSVFAISERSMMALSTIKDAMIFTFFPPAISELGNASGFDMQLIDESGKGHLALMQARNQLLFAASKNPLLAGVRPNGLEDVAQYKIDVNYEKANALGVSTANINSTLQTTWGSSYIGNYVDRGRVKKVYIQAEADSRMLPEDFKKWYIKNNNGAMVPLTSFSSGRWIYGSPQLERFNGYSAVNIQGAARPGVSSGVAMQEMEKIVAGLPQGFSLAWQGISYEEKLAGSKTTFLYIISMLIVFLALAALYESWSIPFSVLLIVPFGFLGALLAAGLRGLNNDVYFQIALLTTVGLSAKNAILIVEFAKELTEKGMETMEATITSIKQRFRPIMMTSMAFILGVVPLAISTGAGSASQNAIGVSVIGGMLFATFITPFFVPAFFVGISKFSKKV